ncbi:beta-lactamase regulating signal transducer with metallopeptidase domain [Anaerobacterium chartisolvens]|uniref:Beta-lactamase regulating signal transducer with metallopeptidase domain n=1 Tax=Anaerobacterium chartisolvens TaxID=1297424 RepID=A0A369AGD9_9FIRM|nr:M56 family metallopeptidase [Anaerobacterium chartisolvens]RCX07346.1 beta-lactamase regulating signal transducer with metallopeptidase domain [Anaerobacterium chartisolvens]
MIKLFTTVLNMSITASYIALAVIAIRLLLKKVPRSFSYALWLAVLIRLVCPFSFNSAFSFLSFLRPNVQASTGTMEYIPYNMGLMQKPEIDVGINGINDAVNFSLPPATPTASVNSIQILMEISSIFWIVGIGILLIYCTVSYLKVITNVKTATLVKDNIFETDRITGPFLCGFFRPKIYVPVGISDNELSYILAHEQTHIQRLDYLIKPFAFLVLIVHWFNPIMWVSFALMSKDMEMSCDESVIKRMGNKVKTDYSNSLLQLSVRRSGLLLGSPLAFGESNIKSRIKNILNYKKPEFWVIILAAAATVLLIFTFTANPKHEHNAQNTYLGYSVETLINNKTPYVGNNSKVVALIDAMPLPEGIVRDTIELQTTVSPYEITINYIMKDSSGVVVNEAVCGDTFYQNSIILFSLIDNVDVINCKIIDKTGKYNGASYAFPYTREAATQLLGEDAHSYARSADTLKALINKVNSVHLIEKYLEIIISSPQPSSNPSDYIKAHSNEYESILKMGDEALNYLLVQFKKGGNNGLKGHIMAALCKDLLGDRNNVTDESLLPQQWFDKLSPYEEVKLPDFKANTSDPIEQLVYDAAVKQYSRPDDGFTVVAPTIFGSYEEGNKLKIIVTVYSNRFRLYNKTLSEVGGSIVPGAITYIKNDDGQYILQEYKECMDGSYFNKSIEDFCTMPVSGNTIKGLYSEIIKDYGSNKGRNELLDKNLKEHLEANNQKGIKLKSRGLSNELVPLT